VSPHLARSFSTISSRSRLRSRFTSARDGAATSIVSFPSLCMDRDIRRLPKPAFCAARNRRFPLTVRFSLGMEITVRSTTRAARIFVCLVRKMRLFGRITCTSIFPQFSCQNEHPRNPHTCLFGRFQSCLFESGLFVLDSGCLFASPGLVLLESRREWDSRAWPKRDSGCLYESRADLNGTRHSRRESPWMGPFIRSGALAQADRFCALARRFC